MRNIVVAQTRQTPWVAKLTILHGYAPGVLHFPLGTAFHTICFHRGPPSGAFPKQDSKYTYRRQRWKQGRVAPGGNADTERGALAHRA